jgi:hypothetical protein
MGFASTVLLIGKNDPWIFPDYAESITRRMCMAASDGEKIRHISEFGIVAERVEPDPAKSQLQTCRNQMVCTNRIGVIGPTGQGNETRSQAT